MNELRKGFYAFDMAVFGFFLFAINHAMFAENRIVPDPLCTKKKIVAFGMFRRK